VPKKIPSVTDLRLPEVLRTLAERRAGLVLLTGGARSGKSVTLAAMIQSINLSRACHVVTLEDPIEFVHEPHKAQITQREIGEHVASFLAGLTGVAYDDADVVAISEIRSHDLMVHALELACAGVLVLGTLPTRGALATLERILDDTPEHDRPHVRRLLANGLAAVVSQQLVDLADGNGKVAAVEVMVVSRAAAAAIRAGKAVDLDALILEPDSAGTQTMDMALEKLVQERAITLETALDKAADRDAEATGAASR
jgi:twitching motility protein PilT